MKSPFRLLKVNFLGQSPAWYKITILSFLIINPLLYFFISPFVAGWAVLVEFIFTLACALKCYPLQPGGLLAIQALVIGLTSPDTVFKEITANIPTLLLLIFMVAAIYFIKDVLFLAITKLFLVIKKKHFLSLVFCLICASLSAFLDALTIVAIAIAVCFNFYAIYHRVESSGGDSKEFEEFRGFLRNLIMHGAVGTIIGGTMTQVGEPQNLMIATKMGWSFAEFFFHNYIISVPVTISALLLCFSLEFFKFPGFRYQMPQRARELITKDYNKKIREMTKQDAYRYVVQAVMGIILVFALAFHLAEVGLIGIGLIVIITAFTGLTKEHDLGVAFNNAMPFAALIVVFFAILGVVHTQHLVTPLAQWVFTLSGKMQLVALYFVNGTLSFVSDNVFIATIFISEVDAAYAAGLIAQSIDKIDAAYAAGTITQFISEMKGAYNLYNCDVMTQFIRDLDVAYAAGTMTQFISEMKGTYNFYNNEATALFLKDFNAAYTAGMLPQFINEIKNTYNLYNNDAMTQFIRDLDAASVNGTMAQFISNIKAVYANKTIISRDWYEKLAVVVNMGTNTPAMATPNGHAALLFLLTSSLAPILKLSYFRMFKLTLPYTIIATTTGALAIYFFL